MKGQSQLFSTLLTAEEMAEYLAHRVSAEQLREFAFNGCPHYRGLDQLWFQRSATEKWITTNIIRKKSGTTMTINVWTTISAAVSDCNLPLPLRGIAGALLPIPNTGSVSGVYFLCLKDEVVYVGQSRNLYSRLPAHAADPNKTFDRIFLLPCPKQELDFVENTFIRVLQPRFNGRGRNGQCLVRQTWGNVAAATATVIDVFLEQNNETEQESSNNDEN